MRDNYEAELDAEQEMRDNYEAELAAVANEDAAHKHERALAATARLPPTFAARRPRETRRDQETGAAQVAWDAMTPAEQEAFEKRKAVRPLRLSASLPKDGPWPCDWPAQVAAPARWAVLARPPYQPVYDWEEPPRKPWIGRINHKSAKTRAPRTTLLAPREILRQLLGSN
jgi:hypothetical protein